MAREVTWGTPGRASQYLFPRSPYGLVFYSLAAGLVVLAWAAVFHLAGWRRPLAPGNLMSAHAPIESRCQECHTAGVGVLNLRCQRCHDPASAGRMDNRAHVLFGSRDPQKAAAAPDLGCALCHVEHKGRDGRLAVVDPAECAECHFSRMSSHPEFSVLTREAVETSGLLFGHQRHVQEVLKADGATNPLESCGRCHEFTGPDFAPLSFDRHCASCHEREGSVGEMDFVREADVAGPENPAARALRLDPSEFESRRGRLRRTVVRHRDPWVLWNLRRLYAELDPEGYATLRGELATRLGVLGRRRALAAPLAGLSAEQLREREQVLAEELAAIEGRLAGFDRAVDPGGGPARLAELALAAERLGAADAERELASLAERAPDGAAPPVSPEELEERKSELLAVLDAVLAADPSQSQAVEGLRRRVAGLKAAQSSEEQLTRARVQRAASLERVRDELALRESGTPGTPNVLLQRDLLGLQRAIEETEARLADLPPAPGGPPLAPEEQGSKLESLQTLTGVCTKCHADRLAPRFRVRAAQPVLVRARFVHEPHLLPTGGDCLKCHPQVTESTLSEELNLKGVRGCQDCHRAGGSRQDCQFCHRYHPPQIF